VLYFVKNEKKKKAVLDAVVVILGLVLSWFVVMVGDKFLLRAFSSGLEYIGCKEACFSTCWF